MNISIDEFLWKFRGRLSFRTYNPSKRARFEVKIYRLSASDGVGAGSVFRIYTGKQKGDMPSSQKAIMDLMQAEGFFDKGYTVFMNNWYTSPVLISRPEDGCHGDGQDEPSAYAEIFEACPEG